MSKIDCRRFRSLIDELFVDPLSCEMVGYTEDEFAPLSGHLNGCGRCQDDLDYRRFPEDDEEKQMAICIILMNFVSSVEDEDD